MKSKHEIEKRRDMFKMLAQETASKIDDLDMKIKRCQTKNDAHYLVKEKESLHILIGIANSQWAELMWVLDE